MGRLGDRQVFWLIAVFVVCIVLVVRTEPHLFGWFGPDGYWATHWARDYSSGFVRRGLLGTLIQLPGGDPSDYAVIAIFSWVIALALMVVIADALWRLTRPLARWQAATILVIVLLSPVTSGMLIETLGDPIQLIVLVYVLLARHLLAGRRIGVITAVFAAFGLTMSLIHEAAVFFVLPALFIQALMLRKGRGAWMAFAACFISSAGGVAVLLLTNEAEPITSNPALHLGDVTYIYPMQFDSFTNLLRDELIRMFASGIGGYMETIARLGGAAALPVFLALLLITFRHGLSRPWSGRQLAVIAAFILPALAIMPLLLVAHDWGRFFAYTFIISMLAMADTAGEETAAPGRTVMLSFLGSGLLLAGLTTTDQLALYRMDGLRMQPHLMLVSFAILLMARLMVMFSERRSGEQQNASSDIQDTGLVDIIPPGDGISYRAQAGRSGRQRNTAP
ncbi:MAG: hypothetical protein CMF01_13530 [Hyphomonas sp.]|nr:hypothetical protein [Hyphomonas sp.]|tara:strand:+ start:37614 stop:38963 length:1350 start_codon:yes stop_codon:yes gene_type:complete